MTTTRWEYRLEVVTLSGKEGDAKRGEAIVTLDALGRDGWEAIALSPSHASSHGLRVETTEYVALLKRPLTSGDRRARQP